MIPVDLLVGLRILSAVAVSGAFVFVYLAHRSARYFISSEATGYAVGISLVLAIHRWLVVFLEHLPAQIRAGLISGAFVSVESILVAVTFVVLLKGVDMGEPSG